MEWVEDMTLLQRVPEVCHLDGRQDPPSVRDRLGACQWPKLLLTNRYQQVVPTKQAPQPDPMVDQNLLARAPMIIPTHINVCPMPPSRAGQREH